jgi:hypothetical protein
VSLAGGLALTAPDPADKINVAADVVTMTSSEQVVSSVRCTSAVLLEALRVDARR